MNLQEFVTSRSHLPATAVKNTIDLLANDATIPFIARYRKELTGSLDEVEIEAIAGLKKNYEDLEKRKVTVLKSIEEQGKLTESLRIQITNSGDLNHLEDLYLPFKKKRKTKADAAIEAGLEPLAKMLMAQRETNLNLKAGDYVRGEFKTVEEAIAGAGNIVAEWINENQKVRETLRRLYRRRAVISAKVKKTVAENSSSQKYRQYFDWEENLNKIPSHRFLAIHRAEKEGVLRIKVEVEKEEALELISRLVLKKDSTTSRFLIEVIEDSFNRLLRPSFQTEFLSEAKARADEEAISVFAVNLEQLLLAPPLGGKRILAIDPGFKSGCKVVCLDEKGFLLHNENIYPHPPQKETGMAMKKIRSLVNAYQVDAISIGNGTASRETEAFVKKIQFDRDVAVFVVNEAGASVYSASKIAREEFPDYDITVRGAVSIGRRLNDPLAELVKIEPKAIGVGQYQHEVDQNKLQERLDKVVMHCVNRIGVNVNTASKELLAYVSGIGPSLAENIIQYRNNTGGIKNRKELLKISRLGEKAFEQSAGFLRIKGGENRLDDSSVHPESYLVVEKMAKDKRLKVEDLIGNKSVLREIQLERYIDENRGLPTIKDILKELEKPGADPREKISEFQFDPSVKSIEDLEQGMKLPGLVNNITNFGCFVDIGIKESGLIHISNLANEYVSDVNAVVKLNQQVQVTVLDVDIERKRIQLSLK